MRKTVKVFLTAFLFVMLALPLLATSTQAATTDQKIAMTGINCDFVQADPNSMTLVPLAPTKPMSLKLTDGSTFVEKSGQLYVQNAQGVSPLYVTNNGYKIVAPDQIDFAQTAPTTIKCTTTVVIIVIVHYPDHTDVIIIIARSSVAAN